MISIVTLLLLLQIKHLIIDWFWQPPYEFMNKGTYGHWGGIRHALKHAWGTFVCLIFFHLGAFQIIGIFALDYLLHYHIDWAKMNLNAKFSLTPKDEKFWWLVGLDQFLHQLTYLLIAGMIFGL